MSGTTVQIEQGRWSWLDAQLVTGAGAGVAAITSATVNVYLKKYGAAAFATKTLDSTASNLAVDAPIGATSIIVVDSSIFPPDFGLIEIDDPPAAPERRTIVSNIPSINTITFDTPLTQAYSAATPSTATLIDWDETTGPPAGFYSVLFNPTELDTLDQFTFVISDAGGGPVFVEFTRTVDIITATSAATESAPTLSSCILKDHILDLNGSPLQNITVSARMLAIPRVAQGAGVSDVVVSSTTDANGFFQLSVLQGATVDIIIPKIGYRRTLIVPSTTFANLFEV